MSLSHIYCTSPDLDAGRLEVAKKLGADHIVQVSTRDSRQLSRIITEQLGCEPDQSIECSGAEPSIATAIYVRELSLSFPLSPSYLFPCLTSSSHFLTPNYEELHLLTYSIIIHHRKGL